MMTPGSSSPGRQWSASTPARLGPAPVVPVADYVVDIPLSLASWAENFITAPVSGFIGVKPAHRNQAEPEVADLGQQPMQRGLISKQTRDDRLRALAFDLETVEPRSPAVAEDALDADLVAGRPSGGTHARSPLCGRAAAGRADVPTAAKAAGQAGQGGARCMCRQGHPLPCGRRAVRDHASITSVYPTEKVPRGTPPTQTLRSRRPSPG